MTAATLISKMTARNTPELEALRAEVELVNFELLKLLCRRGKLVTDIQRVKTREEIPTFLPEREQKMLEDLVARNSGPFSSPTIRHLFQEIFKASVELMECQRTPSDNQMTEPTICERGTLTQRIYEKIVPRGGFTDAYVTKVAASPVTDEAQLLGFFDELAAALAKDRIQILQEKIFGLCTEQKAIFAARMQAFERYGLDLEPPATFIEGAPCIGGILAGVQIVGTICDSDGTRVSTIRYRGTPVGRELRLPGCRMLFYAGVSGFDPQAGRNVTEQAGAMFENTRALLEDQGLSCKNIVRTWIYMARLLDWYGEFNRVRTSSFRRFGIIDTDGNGVLPASTGIQGKRTEGEECFMDVLAIAAEDNLRYRTAPMRNSRQNEACEYGSSFSRGMAVGNDGRPTLWVSGTASINTQGKTVHHGDEQNQVLETVLNIATLLEGQGARLRDICQATAYCKGPGDYRAFERIVDHLDMKDIPFVPVIADVCRDELLFEIDSIAVKGAAQH